MAAESLDGVKQKGLIVADTLKKGGGVWWCLIGSEKEDGVAMHGCVDLGKHLVLIGGLEIG